LSDPRRGKAVFARIGLDERNELRDGFRFDGRMHDQDIRRLRQDRDRREIIDGVERLVCEQARVDHEAARRRKHRVAVGRRLGDQARPDIAAGADHVFDMDRLSPFVGELRRDQTGHDVRRPARRKRHDHANRLARVGLRECMRRTRREKNQHCGRT
jgi:hypothetical protein